MKDSDLISAPLTCHFHSKTSFPSPPSALNFVVSVDVQSEPHAADYRHYIMLEMNLQQNLRKHR